MISPTDRNILRPLAGQIREIAEAPEMAERRRLWTALKDLRAERPMILFETASIEDYVAESELTCETAETRSLERLFRHTIRHATEVGDDLLVASENRLGWVIKSSGFGVESKHRTAEDGRGGSLAGVVEEHPVKTPDDLDRLRPATWRVDRAAVERLQEEREAAFGDLLPCRMRGLPKVQVGVMPLALIGNDNLMMWPYDHPEAMHRLMAFMRDQSAAYLDFLERENLLGFNNNESIIGSGSPGCTTSLPGPECGRAPRLQDVWIRTEAQETTQVSPEMFAEFFLPYVAPAPRRGGLVYYGCCEQLHDRIDAIRQAIPQTRAVSVSPWSNLEQMAAKLGRTCVFSRKPSPGPISVDRADWKALAADVDHTLQGARGCNLEFIFRDVYRIGNDRSRLRQWTDLVRKRIGV